MSERNLRIVPERDVVARDMAYGSSSKDKDLQMLLNKVVGNNHLNQGRSYKEPPSQFVPPTDAQD